MTAPILSICIPTFNRSEFLKDCLKSITTQVSSINDDVEIVVSDNASTDDTMKIVEEAKKLCHIRYIRNHSNIGAARNILKMVRENAEGDFCWILGDDDLIKPGGVLSIFNAVKEHSDLDYFYVNYSLHQPDEKHLLLRSTASITWNSVGCLTDYQGRIDDWRYLVRDDAFGLTPVYASVFRRSEWLKHTIEKDVVGDFFNVEGTYPHTVVLSRMMPGKPAWQSSYPWVSVFVSQSSWSDFEPLIILKRYFELLDLMESSGIDESYLRRHRSRMLSLTGDVVLSLLRGQKFKMLTRRDALIFAMKYWFNPKFARSIVSAIRSRLAKH